MRAALYGGLIGLIAAIFLRATYQLISNRWPEGYDYSTRMIERAPRNGVLSYLLFRFSPTYIVGVLAIVTSDRLGGNVVVAATILGVVYIGAGEVWAAINCHRHRDPRKNILIALYMVNALLVLAALILAILSRHAVAGFVPDPTELLSSLWTACFVAVFVYFLDRVFRRDELRNPTLSDAREMLGVDLEEYAKSVSVKMNCSPELVLAVVLAECEQRPKWFRDAERVFGRLTGSKGISYGVGQIRSDRPLSDMQSIDYLCAGLSGYFPGSDRNGSTLELRIRLADHNPDPVFVATAVERYFELIPEIVSCSSEIAYDKRPTVEIYRPQFNGDVMRIHGSTARSSSPHVWNVGATTSSGCLEIADISVTTAECRTEFSCDTPSFYGELHLMCDGIVVGEGFSLDGSGSLPW